MQEIPKFKKYFSKNTLSLSIFYINFSHEYEKVFKEEIDEIRNGSIEETNRNEFMSAKHK